MQNFTVVFQSEPEGGYTAIVPTLPGCVTYGKNLEEAKRMVVDAIKGYIASLHKHNEPVPSSGETFIGNVQLSTVKSQSIHA
jgi:predicted RNase H-like HicB family nuclease